MYAEPEKQIMHIYDCDWRKFIAATLLLMNIITYDMGKVWGF